MPIGNVTGISVANCDRVTINTASFAGPEAIQYITIKNVSDLHLKPVNDRYTARGPESSEPKSAITSGLKFRATNVSIKGDMVRNTFCGVGFDVIGIKFKQKP